MSKAKLTVYFDNRQNREKAGFALRCLVKKTIRAALSYQHFEMPTELSVTFVDNEQIHEMNREYRNVDRATDVLSFPMYDFRAGEEPLPDETAELGDIVISLEKARSQAEEYGHSFRREVAFLTAHSMLHLLGYDHELSEEDDRDMRRRQSEILASIGLTRGKTDENT